MRTGDFERTSPSRLFERAANYTKRTSISIKIWGTIMTFPRTSPNQWWSGSRLKVRLFLLRSKR